MLRLANKHDVELVSTLCEKFFRQTKYAHIDTVNVNGLVDPFLQPAETDKICILWDADPFYGIIGGHCTIIPFIQRKVAIECLWYVDEELRGSAAGKELLDAFEHWASLVGADLIQMMCMSDQTGKLLDRYYKKRGYTLTELTYTKEL